jgi:hypothetical protein
MKFFIKITKSSSVGSETPRPRRPLANTWLETENINTQRKNDDRFNQCYK